MDPEASGADADRSRDGKGEPPGGDHCRRGYLSQQGRVVQAVPCRRTYPPVIKLNYPGRTDVMEKIFTLD